MPHAVRCPRCSGLSRVDDAGLGGTVECPHCRAAFAAAEPAGPAPKRVSRSDAPPTVAPVGPARRPDPEPDFDPDPPPPRLAPAALGLALVPLGIPLLWLAGPVAFGRPPLFTFALPVAIALGTAGLAAGAAAAAGWSVGARVRTVLALVAVAYAVSLTLFAAEKEWAVAARRRLPAGNPSWQVVADKTGWYKVTAPGRAAPATASPLPGWPLEGVRVDAGETARNGFWRVGYEVAAGKPAEPARLNTLDDADWFALAKTALVEATGGVVKAETPFQQQTLPGCEFLVELPDGTHNRVVRVVRDKKRRRAFYLAAEGAFLPPDLRDVTRFFDSFVIDPK